MVQNLIPLALAIVGAAIPLVGGGFDGWPIALAWLAAFGLAGIARAAIYPTRQTNVFVDIVGLVLTLLLVPEGGLWFVPAVVAQTCLDRKVASHPCARLT